VFSLYAGHENHHAEDLTIQTGLFFCIAAYSLSDELSQNMSFGYGYGYGDMFCEMV
jgi:hypothetical protein